LLVTFWYYPAVKLFQQSLTNWNGISRTVDYIGFDNYIKFLKSPETYYVLSNNLAHLIAGLLQVVIGLYLATVLHGKLKGTNFFKSVLFMPCILNIAAVVYMFNYIYDSQRSPINTIIRSLGFENYTITFLSEKYWSNFALAAVGMWLYTGMVMVIFLGALQSVPKEMYEAAEVDGANFLHKLWHITIPNIKTAIELLIFLAINGSLQAFIQPLFITHGGPGVRTETIASYVLKIAFSFQNFGMASAMGVMLMLMIFMLVSIQRYIMKGREG
jgi:multiple sugar transport system permease protein